MSVPAGQIQVIIPDGGIVNLAMESIANGRITFRATDAQDRPIPVLVGGAKQALNEDVSRTIANGAMTAELFLPDPSTSSPKNYRLRVTVWDFATNKQTVYRNVPITGIAGGGWNFSAQNLSSEDVSLPTEPGPIGINYRGDFTAATAYYWRDAFTAPSGDLYFVNASFVSGGAFSTGDPIHKILPGSTDTANARDINVIGRDYMTRAGYIRISDGAFVPDTNWLATDLLPVDSLQVNSINLYGNPETFSVAFYDHKAAFLSGTAASADGAFIAAMPSAPAGAVFVAFVMFNVNPQQQHQTLTLRAPIFSHAPIMDLKARAKLAGYITLSGGFTADTNWRSTDFIPAVPWQAVDVTVIGNNQMCVVAAYSAASSSAFLQGFSPENVTTTAYSRRIILPAGTTHFRFCMCWAAVAGSAPGNGVFGRGSSRVDGPTYGSYVNPESRDLLLLATPYRSPRRLKLTSSSKILLYGDSISSTDYPWYQQWMAQYTGAQVYNGGYAGTVAGYQVSNAAWARVTSYAPDVVIFLPGANDRGIPGTYGSLTGLVAGEPIVPQLPLTSDFPMGANNYTYGGTSVFTGAADGAGPGACFAQAVDYGIRRFLAQYGNWRANAGLTGSETEAQKATILDAVQKPVLVVCTPLPQKRVNANDSSSQPDNWRRRRDVVVECCHINKIHCVDLFNFVGWDMAQEPYQVGATDTAHNNGLYTMDGLHPNKYGAQRMVEHICADLGIG